MKQKPEKEVKRWLEGNAELFLEDMGLRKGQKVLDFGCNEGNYTIPAAKIVAEEGKVYALDREEKSLAKTIEKARTKKLKNVIGIICSYELSIPLNKKSVDVILLYDVLHRGYFPEAQSRKRILNSLYETVRKNGFISVYLTHLKQFGMTFKKALKEIEGAGFIYSQETRKKLVHDNNLVRGRIFTFRKTELT